MAFNLQNLATIGGANIDAPTIYTYKSDDDLATVTGTGYFDDKRHEFEEGDIIRSRLDDVLYTLEVSADTSTCGLSQLFDSVVSVKQASQLSGTLSGFLKYVPDGQIDMGAQSIEVPAAGLTIGGHGVNVSRLFSTENSYDLFTSPVGGSGDLFCDSLSLSITGTGSRVYNIVADTGAEAIESTKVNYVDCTSLGVIDGYRQGLEEDTGRFGGKPELELENTWSGGYFINTSIVRSLIDGAYTLFKAGASFTMASRFRSNQNIDLPASASFFDFSASNFANPSTLQMDGCIITRGGVSDSSDANLTPNISASSLASSWSNNQGLPNTFEGGQMAITTEATTTIVSSGAFVDLAGTFTASDLQHFDSPSNGQLRHLGTSPVEYKLNGQFVLESEANDDVDLKVVIFRSATTSFEDGRTVRRVIDRLQGQRNVGYFVMIDNVTLNQNDYIKFQAANVDATNDITAELDSFIFVEAR